MKKTLSKVAHNRPNFFSVLPTGPTPARIFRYFQKNLPPREFSIMTLTIAYLIPMHENNTASKGDLISEYCPDLKRNCMKLQALNFSLQFKKLRN